MNQITKTTGDKQDQLAGPPLPGVWGRVARAAGCALAVASLVVAAFVAPAANASTGYTAKNGEMWVDATCMTNSYGNGTPNYIVTTANAFMEPGYATQRVGLVLWFYRVESRTWYTKDMGAIVTDASHPASFYYPWAPPLHGHYSVVGRFYYGRINAPSVATDLAEDWYENTWNGLDLAPTWSSCSV
jgi:hypothetical protein